MDFEKEKQETIEVLEAAIEALKHAEPGRTASVLVVVGWLYENEDGGKSLSMDHSIHDPTGVGHHLISSSFEDWCRIPERTKEIALESIMGEHCE